jgi:hypothetical protein
VQWRQPAPGATNQIQQDGMQSNGTGPANRQLRDRVGGVMPAGLFLLIERRDELLAIVPFVTRS